MKDGLSDGMKDGLSDGMKDGLSDGMKDGLSDGMKEGLSDGIKEGLSDGIKDGLSDSMQSKHQLSGGRNVGVGSSSLRHIVFLNISCVFTSGCTLLPHSHKFI